MPWDGSGSFERSNGTNSGPETWEEDRDAAAKILASRHDIHDEDIATGLENCVTRDGQNAPSANLPMGTNRHTNVGAAVAATDYARADQVQKSAFSFCATAGTSTAYTASLSPAPAAYVDGITVLCQIHTTNCANPTLNLNGLGAVSMVTTTSVPVPSSTLSANGFYLFVLSSGNFHLVNP
jgi:hypothetical protein